MMPYCTECGVYFDELDSNCPDCGQSASSNNVAQPKPTLSHREADQYESGTVDTASDESSFVPQGTTVINQSRLPEDNHLGKGIIKPQKVEVDHDGVHFKYDIPAHSFMKAEPTKDKPIEFRITAAEMETKNFHDLFQEKEPLETELPIMNTDVPEATLETTVPDELPIDNHDVESIIEEESPEVIEDEPIPEPAPEENVTAEVLPEPEIKEAEDTLPEILWEARETWFRIPLFNQYRLTNRSLIIIDGYNHHFLEMPLSLITGVVVQCSWFARLFNIGNVKISVRDFSATTVILGGIPEPARLKEQLENLCQRKL